MGEYDPNAWGLGSKSESLLDAPKQGWGESMMSKGQREKIDPIGDLGKFAAEKDAESKEGGREEKKSWGQKRDQGIKFTDPVMVAAEMPPVPKGKWQFPLNENGVGGSSGIAHDWKITSGAADEETLNTWNVAEGKVYYLNDGTEATVAAATVTGEAGGIYIHVVRDPSSRAATAQTVEFYVETPVTTETDQYFLLGMVGGTPTIIQKQFTPLRVYEDLFVINGEFKLGSIAMLADNLYTPPA